jgi:competence protein ComEC
MILQNCRECCTICGLLFTGDAESSPENAMVQNYNVDTTILKVGHHGSSSSTRQAFLNEVSPEVAVISVGEDNSYGHPAQTTLNKLESVGAYVYRTDIDGTVIVSTDGYSYNVNTEMT